jgi:hypothetical protein
VLEEMRCNITIGMSILTNAETVKVMDEAATDGSFTIAQTNGQERRDTRQNCRQANGAVGADKRHCRQQGRRISAWRMNAIRRDYGDSLRDLASLATLYHQATCRRNSSSVRQGCPVSAQRRQRPEISEGPFSAEKPDVQAAW